MFRRNIPEEDLASLSESVRSVIHHPAIFEYRQHELEQAPDPEIVKKAQVIWEAVIEVKKELDNMDSKQAKQKIANLESMLDRINEKEYIHLISVIQKAQEIAEFSKELIEHDPDFIAVSRKEEIHVILESGFHKLSQMELDDIIEEADKREKILPPKKSFSIAKILLGGSEPVLPLIPKQEVSAAFDHCVDEAFTRFSKTKLGEYVRKYQTLLEKFGQKRKWREKEIVKLRVELEGLRKKLLPEEQKKLANLQLREKTRLEILIRLLPDEDYNRFINQLKRTTKPTAKQGSAAKFE